MRSVTFGSLARTHLLQIARYLHNRTGDERAGEKLIRSIEARMNKAGELTAKLGRPRTDLGEGVRSLPHKDYLIFFRYEEDSIAVLHVLHGHRDVEAYLAAVRDD